MMKSARKKLKKLWPKKRKKNTHYIDDGHRRCCQCSYSYPTYVHPSAPPLPPNWVDMEEAHQPIWPEIENSSPSAQDYEASHQLDVPEASNWINDLAILKKHSNKMDEAASAAADYPSSSSASSYQQYMIPSPDFCLLASEKKVIRPAATAGIFSCLFKFGTYFLRRVCLCLSIRD